MSIEITSLNKEEAKAYLEQFKVDATINKKIQDNLKKLGWEIEDYVMRRKYKGYYLIIEFCIGDYCCYPASKNGQYVLEPKYKAMRWVDAYMYILDLQQQIDNGKHWTGEDD